MAPRRVELPAGPLFCVVNGPTRGRPWSAPPSALSCAARREAGVRRRFAPHQLRHAHAVEMAREGVSLNVIQRQLGHTNLGTTTVYLQGIDIEEIIETVDARRAPITPVGHVAASFSAGDRPPGEPALGRRSTRPRAGTTHAGPGLLPRRRRSAAVDLPLTARFPRTRPRSRPLRSRSGRSAPPQAIAKAEAVGGERGAALGQSAHALPSSVAALRAASAIAAALDLRAAAPERGPRGGRVVPVGGPRVSSWLCRRRQRLRGRRGAEVRRRVGSVVLPARLRRGGGPRG